MKIKDIYKNFNTPPNLQEHMLLVTHVATSICDNWNGDLIDKDKILKATLLHDLGNIVRFTFDETTLQIMGDESSRIDYWKQVQENFIRKYGVDDHEATRKMLSEINIEPDIIDTILNKSFGNSVKTYKEGDWILKILSYSDMRVVPTGIVSLEERLQDISTRLKQYKDRPDLKDLCDSIRYIEKEIQLNLNISLESISNELEMNERNLYLNIEC